MPIIFFCLCPFNLNCISTTLGSNFCFFEYRWPVGFCSDVSMIGRGVESEEEEEIKFGFWWCS